MNIHSSDLITEILMEAASPSHSQTHRESIDDGFPVISSDTELGAYRSIIVKNADKTSFEDKQKLCRLVGKYISRLISQCCDSDSPKILVAGLGNPSVASDSLGALTAEKTAADGERIFSIVPLTKAKTGLSSASIVREAANLAEADVIIAADALAAAEAIRLGRVIQISDGGIRPGSGVCCAADEISSSTMPCPVIAVGVPTVIRSDIAIDSDAPPLFVTPANVSAIINTFSSVIAGGINIAALRH